jgi:hypothetical protein
MSAFFDKLGKEISEIIKSKEWTKSHPEATFYVSVTVGDPGKLDFNKLREITGSVNQDPIRGGAIVGSLMFVRCETELTRGNAILLFLLRRTPWNLFSVIRDGFFHLGKLFDKNGDPPYPEIDFVQTFADL